MSQIKEWLRDAPEYDPNAAKSGATAPGSGQKSQIKEWLRDAPPQDRGFTGWARDAAAWGVKGAIAVPEAAVGLADLASGGRAGKALEGVGVRFKDARELANEWHSEATKEAQRKFHEAEGFGGKLKAALQNPSNIVGAVIESAPSMLAGGVAARGLQAATRLGQMGAKGAVAAGALGEGVVGAGSAAEQIRQETEDGHLGFGQAGAALATGAATAGFGLMGGKLAQRLGVGDVDTLLAQGQKGVARGVADEAAEGATRAAAHPVLAQKAAKSIPRQVVEGAISEGLLEELPQSVAEQVLQNLALDKPWSEGVDAAAVMGLLSGGVMGAGAAGHRGFRAPAGGDVAGDVGAPSPVADESGVADEGIAPPVQPEAPPRFEALRQAWQAQMEALQEQESGEPDVPQSAPPDGAAALSRQRAAIEAQREADRQSASPDDEILQSTGAASDGGLPSLASGPVRPSEAMGLRAEDGPLSAAAVQAVDSGVSAGLQQAASAAAGAESKPGGIDAAPQLEAMTDAELSATFRSAQAPDVRKKLEQELGRRRQARQEDAKPNPDAASDAAAKLRDVEARIIEAARQDAAVNVNAGGIEAAMQSRRVPVPLKAQRNRLLEQVRQSQTAGRAEALPAKAAPADDFRAGPDETLSQVERSAQATNGVPQRLQADLGYNLRHGFVVGDGRDIEALAQQVGSSGAKGAASKGVRYALPTQRLSQDLGIDLSGYKHQVTADGIAHALASHGDAKREAARGQEAVTAADFARIPQIVAEYDHVEMAGRDSAGNDLIRYRKAFNGSTYYVEEVRPKRGDLTIKTLWKTPTRAQMLPQDAAPPAYARSASVGTPPQGSASVSLGGDAGNGQAGAGPSQGIADEQRTQAHPGHVRAEQAPAAQRGGAEPAGQGAARADAQRAGDAGGAADGGEGVAAEGLSNYTEQELRQREQQRQQAEANEQRRRADIERRAQADAERDEFVLTGSDRAADEATARGQQPMFSRSQPTHGWLDGQPYNPPTERLSDQEAKLVLDTFNAHTDGEKAAHVWQVQESHDIESKSKAFQALAAQEGWRVGYSDWQGKYLRLENADGVSLQARVSDHSNVNRGAHFKESAINLAPDDGYAFDDFESALWKLRNAGEDEDYNLTFGGEEAVYFSRAGGREAETEAERQFKETERAYGGKDAWEKAKAAGRTKLTYGQWVQVRTPKFKEWFGDWEASRGRRALRQDVRAISLSGQEVSQRTGDSIDMKAMRAEAAAYAQDHVLGKHTNIYSGVTVEVRSVKEALQHHSGPDKLRALAAIPDVLRFGAVVFDGVNPKRPRERLVVIAGRVRIAGQDFLVSAGAREDANGRLFYDHAMLGVEKAEARLSSKSGAAASPGSAPSSASARLNDYTLAFMAQVDADVSQVTDPDTGEPLVVYHGTDKQFNTFTTQPGLRGNMLTGEIRTVQARAKYFTPDEEYAASYGSSKNSVENYLMPVFLHSKWLARLDGFTDIEEYTTDTEDEFENQEKQFWQYLEDDEFLNKFLEDYDGAVFEAYGSTEYVVFDPTQIKSATDNNGDFDAGNPDIRYSISAKTRAAYEARIDALFAGEKASRQGAVLLDRSDVMGLLGHANVPMVLNERHLLDGLTNHPEMTAQAWKRVPEWLENPAAVYTDPKHPGRLTVIAPERLSGYPVVMAVELAPDSRHDTRGAHQLLVTAFAKKTGDLPALGFLASSGRLLYTDTKTAPVAWPRTRDVPRTGGKAHGAKRILTEKNLAGWRKANAVPAAAQGALDPALARKTVALQQAVDAIHVQWENAPPTVVVADMGDARIPQPVRAADKAQKSRGAKGEPEGFYYDGKVYLVASQVKDGAAAARVMAHEVLGHHGLQGMFGKRLDSVLNRIGLARRAAVVAKARSYGLHQAMTTAQAGKVTDAELWRAMTAHERRVAAEEVLAEMAQAQPKIGFVREAIAAIRAWLRQHVPGFNNLRVTDDEIIREYILPARGWVIRGERAQRQGSGYVHFQLAWHGTPHRGIEKTGFKLNKIGTGEGAQAYGWGIYFASKKEVAEGYSGQQSSSDMLANGESFNPRSLKSLQLEVIASSGDLRKALAVAKKLAKEGDANAKSDLEKLLYAASVGGFKTNRGQLYQVDIPEDSDLLDFDAPLSKQPPKVRKAIERIIASAPKHMRWIVEGIDADTDGNHIYGALGDLSSELASEEDPDSDGFPGGTSQAASELLREHGIPGLRYLDGNSRADGEGSHNYVIWDEALLTPEAAQIEPMFSRKSNTQGGQSDTEKARILQGEPVARLSTKDAPSGSYGDVVRAVARMFARQGGVATSPDIGEVVLDERAAKSSMAHGGANIFKQAAFAAVKDVIERGAVVMQAQHARDGTSFYIAAPVTIDGGDNMVTVLVRKDANTQRMYLHSVRATKNLLDLGVSRTDTESGVERSGSTSQEGTATVTPSPKDGKATSDAVTAELRRLLALDVQGDAGGNGLPMFSLSSEERRIEPVALKLQGWQGTQQQLDALARAWYGSHLQGKSFHNDDMNVDVLLSSEGKGTAFATSGNLRVGWRAEMVRVLPDLIRRAVRVGGSQPDDRRAHDSRAFHALVAALRIGDEDYAVKLTVREALQGPQPRHKFYDVTGVQIKRSPGVYGFDADASASRPTPAGASSEPTVAELAEAVNVAPQSSGAGPMFSLSQPGGGHQQEPPAWAAPEPSRFDDVVYKMQDKHIDAKRVQEAIEKVSGQIDDAMNVRMAEELYHGRTAKRVQDFGREEVEPLMRLMQQLGLGIADVEEFLHARHAKEANALIASRDEGMPDGGSGMRNADADAYFANLDAGQRARLEQVAAQVDAMIATTRQMYVDYGLEDQATVDGWASQFQHYVPLMREGHEGGMGIGQGFSIKGPEVKGRTGSRRRVVDILANIVMQREKLIVRGEKNRVALAAIGLAEANPNADFWRVGDAPKERVLDKNGKVVERVDPLHKSRDNVLVAKMRAPGGRVVEKALTFNETDPRARRMAQALKNLDAASLEGLMGVSAKITRYFSAVNTQYNPLFGPVNLVRDVQGSLVNLQSTPLAGMQAEVMKETGRALAAIYGELRRQRKGKGRGDGPWARLLEQFQQDGGQTGYRDQFATSEDRARALQRIMTPTGWMDSKLGKVMTAGGALRLPLAAGQRGLGVVLDWLSDYNDTMENAVRLSVYKVALGKGLSRAQAASMAKNISVNFNRKGQSATQAGALYAFFNAAMQGTARIGQTLFTMDGGDVRTLRLSRVGKQVVYGGLVLGVLQALALAAAGLDDEEVPEFVRERSLIIPLGGGKYAQIPMPLGLHVIPGLGRNAAEFVLSGGKDPAKRLAGMLGMLADAFNPIGNAGLSMQTLAPTPLDPLVALTENRDFTGREIARRSRNEAVPGHVQGKDTATPVARAIAEGVNWLSGGNQYRAGVFSPTPDQVDYLIGQATGGVGREASKSWQTIGALRTGEELPPHKVPGLGRFFGNADGQSTQTARFYAATRRLNALETEIKGLRADGKMIEAQRLLRAHPEAGLMRAANIAERHLAALRKQKRELIARGAGRNEVKAIEERMHAAMRRFNERMAATVPG